jgi:hypothetical protein
MIPGADTSGYGALKDRQTDERDEILEMNSSNHTF